MPAACLLFPLLYSAFVYIDNKGGFGSVLSVIYIMPLVCLLVACRGSSGLRSSYAR